MYSGSGRGASSLRTSSPGRSGGEAGKGRRPCSYVSGIWISASKRRCKMLIGGDDFSNDVITLGTCFFNVCSHSHSFSLRADWRKSDSSVDGEPQGNWKWNLTLQALLPYRLAAREPLRACSQTSRGGGGRREKLISHSRSFFKTIPHPAHLSSLSRAKIWANPASRVADPTNDWNPEFKFHLQKPEFSSWNPKSTAWNPESKTVLDSLVRGVITCEWQNRRFVSNKCVSKARYNVTNKKSNFGKLLGQ